MISLKQLRISQRKTEDAFAREAGISRLTLRQIESGRGNPTLLTLKQIAKTLDKDLVVLLAPSSGKCRSDDSTVGVSFKVMRDGFDTWPIYFLEFVDAFRKTLDMRLILLPPVRDLDAKLLSLLASITLELCAESGMEAPSWAKKSYFLDQPWFISDMESLKATAIQESSLYFRRNNIFVQDNFLKRA